MAGKRAIELLTPDEVKLLIKACSNRAPTGIRNRALIVVMYRGGLRVDEALSLFPKDLNLDEGTITILHGKGDRRRVVGIELGALGIIARWLDRRRSLGLNGRRRLFCTLQGKPLSDRYVRAMMKRKADRAGIEKRVHPHALRHARAAELERAGVRVSVIQRILGHSSLATTQVYLNHLSPTEVIEAMQSEGWEL